MKIAVTVRPNKQAPRVPDSPAELAPQPPGAEVLSPRKRPRTRAQRPGNRFFGRAPNRRKEADAAQLAADVAAYDRMAAEPIPPRPQTRPPIRARTAAELALCDDRRKGIVE